MTVTAAIVTMAVAPARSDAPMREPDGGSGAEHMSAIEVPLAPRQPEREPSAAGVGFVADSRPVDPVEQILPVVTGGQGIPALVRAAYQRAAALTAAYDPGCVLTWEVLAGVGRVESGHASGGRVDDGGTTRGRSDPGKLPGRLRSRDADDRGQRWRCARQRPGFDRAVGPMQFLPATWAGYAADGNDDGLRDPHNVFDASLPPRGTCAPAAGTSPIRPTCWPRCSARTPP